MSASPLLACSRACTFSAAVLERPQVSDKFEIIETDSSIWATFEPEDGIFLALTAAKTWLPRHVSQENLLKFLMHTHQLMNVLFCGVQYMLQKDETGHLARSSIAHVLKNAGDELLNSSSWVSRELRSPLTTLGHAAVLSVPLPVTLKVHSLCHRALTVVHNDMQLTENCLVLFNRCVLWSSLRNEDTAALSALCRSSIFPQQQQSTSSTSPIGLLRGTTTTGASTSQQRLSGITGASSSKLLLQLESGFYVMRDDCTTATATATDLSPDNNTAEQLQQSSSRHNNHSYFLPFVYCESSLNYLLAYGRGDLLTLMLGSRSTVSTDALNAIQRAIEPLTVQLLTTLAQECQLQGGELGHIPGWRYSVQETSAASTIDNEAMATATAAATVGGGIRASPRSKVSAMTHHARALATAVTDSLGRLEGAENSIQICARSTQGVWVVGQQERQRRCVVVREKRVEGDASESIISIEKSLQTLGLV
ncbi:hypothetical protein Ndes2526B_g07919 [Nannochloris sp. 'desiccata']